MATYGHLSRGNQIAISQLSRRQRKAKVDADDDDQRFCYGSRNERNERHGKGAYYFVNGDYYFGNWRKGRMEGQGKYVAADGKKESGWFYKNKYVGEMPNQKLHDKIKKELIPGPDGRSACREENNDERYVGEYDRKGRPHKEGAYYFSDGRFYKGNWRKGRMEGKGRLVYANGREESGWFYKDAYVGHETNRKLLVKIKKGMIPGPDGRSACREESTDSESEDDCDGGAGGPVEFLRACQRLREAKEKKNKN